ncbi:MAG: LruC domain-containing protein [Paludibacter sp.]
MKTMWNKSILLTCLMTFSFYTQAAVILNGESGKGNKSIDIGNCWNFAAISYTNDNVITGSYSYRSNQSTNSANWMTSPWIRLANQNITLKTKLELPNNGSGTSRSIVFSYIKYDETQKNVIKEGEIIEFYTYKFPTPFSTSLQELSIPMPSAIVNSNQPYKIEIKCDGDQGNTTVLIDDINIPGDYFSDPSNHCLPMGTIVDTDKDGVQDADDAYPNDATRAYNNYYPSDKVFGTLAFEDNWPGKGDYDMNDVVVDYKMNRVTNAQNDVVEIVANLLVRASGANHKNAFGFQLNGIAPDAIGVIKGNKVGFSDGLFKFKSNGLEENQQFANCIVFDNFFSVLKPAGSGVIGTNVEKGGTFVPYVQMTVTLPFVKKVSISELTNDKFNFYIVSDIASADRGREIHLPDAVPTSLANQKLFGTSDDRSNGSHFYRTANNLPWAINILQGFEYPIEKVSIDKGYNYFIKWAESSGEQYKDWFENIQGYRNSENIYSR